MNNSIPPHKNPAATISHGIIFSFSAISIAGDNNDQNDAAIITPAANPNIPSIIPFFTFLKKNTIAAPQSSNSPCK